VIELQKKKEMEKEQLQDLVEPEKPDELEAPTVAYEQPT
jgi:hypothetical protein